MPRNKEHERTQVMAVREIREDFREETERALSGLSLPPQKKQEVVTRVGAMMERYTSDYPHPDVLKQIEALAPGSAAMIVAAATETVKHNNYIEKRELELREKELAVRERELSVIENLATQDFSSVKDGRRYGLVGFICVLIFSGVMYYLGAEKLSYIAFGVGSLGIVASLIAGGRKLDIKREAEKESSREEESVGTSITRTNS